MRLTVFTEPQLGATYDDQLRVARRAEECGFDAFFRSDHYLTMPPWDHGSGPTDAWATIAALGRETSRIRLGTLVSPATFRYPGPLAVTVAQADVMSGGRVELGLGAGWYEQEHRAYAIPFPPLRERFDRLEEQLEIITGLWTSASFTFRGAHYEVVDSPGLPKPVQSPHPTLIVGGRGQRRTPALAARFADEYNLSFRPLGDTKGAFDRVAAACAAIGRSAPPVYSVAQTVCCGRSDAELRRRADACRRSVDDLRDNAIFGTPEAVVERLTAYAGLGASRVHLQFLDLDDLDHLDLVAAEVCPEAGRLERV